MKNMRTKKKYVLILFIIIVILINSIILMNNIIPMTDTTNIPIKSAAVEDGIFDKSEIPYNLKIVKAGNYSAKYLGDGYFECDGGSGGYLSLRKSEYLDSEGRVWLMDDTKLKQKFSDKKFKDIATGRNHSIAIDEEGYLWSWGSNKYGQLGNGTTDDSDIPVSIIPTKKFKYIACSDYSSFAIDLNDNLYAWGSNKYCEVQNNDGNVFQQESKDVTGSQGRSHSVPIQKMPQKILEGHTFKKVVASYRHIIAIDNEGYAWGWGVNNYGEIGNYELNSKKDYAIFYINRTTKCDYIGEASCIEEPTKISETEKFIDASIGYEHAAFITEQGKAYTLGHGFYGALGNGKNDKNLKEIELIQPSFSEDLKFKDVIAGYYFTGFIDNDNNVWMCGFNSLGCVGNGSGADTATIVKVKVDNITFDKFLNDSAYMSVQVLDNKEDLWGWGMSGQLLANEVGSDTFYKSPIRITAGISEYTVTFKDGDTVLNTQQVTSGGSATAPELTKPGYTLTWDKAFNNVTSDLTVNAVWTPASGTAYKVEHYKQKVSLDGYDIVTADTQNLTGTTGQSVTVTPNTYEGFTAKADNILTGTIAGDGSLVIKVYYDRNQYTVTFVSDGATAKTQPVAYEGATTAPELTKPGYTLSWDKAFNHVTSDLTVNAVWTPASGTAYRVEHYKQKVSLDGYDIVTADTQNLTGTTGQSVTVTPNTYEGFTAKADNVLTGTIAGDGSLVIKVYYDRNQYTVTFVSDGATAKTQPVTYGGSATAPELTKVGYTLSWDKAFNHVTSNLTINAVWTPASGTAYKVEHYKQNLNLDGYDIVTADTQNLTGTTGQTVTVTPNTYEGFTAKADNVLTGTIAGDGNLVIKVYYDRNQYDISYYENGGTINQEDYVTRYTYGMGANLPSNVTKQGYNFGGWYDNSELTGNAIAQISTNDLGNKEYYAKWMAQGDTAYTVKHYKQVGNTDEYRLEETENLTAATGEQVSAAPKNYTGYIENTSKEERVPEGTVLADGSLELRLFYDTIKHTVTFKNGDEIAKTEIVAHGQGATAPVLTKDGYVLRWDKPYTNVTTDITVNAQWLKDTDGDGIPDIEDDDTKVTYTVKHYKQVENTNEYRLEETENLQGQLGSIVTAVAKAYEGYIENTSVTQRIPTGIVVEDGSLELRLFYDTIKLTVTFKDGKETVSTQTVMYGKDAVVPVLTKDGYVLRWDKPYTNVTTDLTINAVWLVDSDGDGIPDIEDDDTKAAYKVEHYLQTKTGYELRDTQNLTAKIGDTVTATAKTYASHNINKQIKETIESGVVTQDGKLVLKLYYDYKQFTVIFKDGDKVVSTQTVIYGGNATAPKLTKPGYILSWNKAINNITGDTTLLAVWTKDPNYIDPNDGKEERPSILPKTGEDIAMVMILSGITIMIAGAGILFYQKRKK